jgi:hypothetical protein
VVEYLLRNHEALSSNPSTGKKTHQQLSSPLPWHSGGIDVTKIEAGNGYLEADFNTVYFVHI